MSALDQLWYVVETPFINSDCSTWVIAGSDDPSAGTFICDPISMSDIDGDERQRIAKSYEIAERIVKDHNLIIRARKRRGK